MPRQMIKPEELRIGNLVMAKRYGSEGLHLTKVEKITKQFRDFEGKWQAVYCINHGFMETGVEWGPIIKTEVRPIPLTEDVLIRLGFEEVRSIDDDNKNAYEIGSWGRIVLKDGLMLSDEYYFLDGLTQDIKYVHQLQNLYFALTGKELTFK